VGERIVLYGAPGVAYAWGRGDAQGVVAPQPGALGRGTLGVAVTVVEKAALRAVVVL